MLITINLSAQMAFIENKNRFPSDILYNNGFNGGMGYFKRNGVTFLLKDKVSSDSLWHQIHFYKYEAKPVTVRYHRFDIEFDNASPCDVMGSVMSVSLFNFLRGKERSNWDFGCRQYQTITYQNLYPKTDWEVNEYGDGLKHNFILKPGSDPSQINIRYKYTEGLTIKEGRLICKTSVGIVSEEKPRAFQIIGGDTISINCDYGLKKSGNDYIVYFKLGKYNKASNLIIDPILVFSTYSGSEGDNFGFTSTYDTKSHLYAGGIVDGGTGTNGGPFPVTPGAFQTVYSGGVGLNPANLPCDIGINKYDSAGNKLLYSTYLGGGSDEYPHSLVVDLNDNLLVMGTTYSQDFPMDTIGYDLTFNGKSDIFIVKLAEDGSDLLASTFMGGSDFDGLNSRTLRYNYADDFRGDIIVDTADNVYVASTTYSSNFPNVKSVQFTRGSVQDGCVFSLNKDLIRLRFSTFIGGNGDDALYSIRLIDTLVYVGGGTASSAMSFSVNGHKNGFSGGRADGLLLKMNTSGMLLGSSYFGTSTYDQIHFLDIDAYGQIYAAGQTDGNLIRSPGTYGTDKTSQFIVRYNSNLSSINLSTTFGNRLNNPEISPSAFLVDKCNNIYFSGWGSPITDGKLHSLTTAGLQVSSDAIQKTTDNADFYLLVLNKDAQNLLYATYYGGDKTEDHVDGGTSRFDKRGVVYQSVCSSCPDPNQHFNDFPVTSNAPFKTNLSPRCSNASFKIDFQINFDVDAEFIANPKTGCEPLTVTFTNKSKKARKYLWDFGDGNTDTVRSPVHTYSSKGKYKVKLTCIDSFSCNIFESDSTIIEVKEMPKADFEFESVECSREFKFKNKSENYADPEWDFGDTTPIVKEENPTHTFIENGNYKVLLKVTHPSSGCVDTQSVYIVMDDSRLYNIKIPNVFTPNNDSKNDCYTVGGIIPGCDEIDLYVYDRWGVKVYEGTIPGDCWDGYLYNNGTPLPDGTYYYIMTIRSKQPQQSGTKTVSGTIRLIR